MADSQDKEAQDSAKEPALTPKEPKPTAPKPAPGQDPAQDADTDWKTEARKWEDRAKANRNEVRELRIRTENGEILLADPQIGLEDSTKTGTLSLKNSQHPLDETPSLGLKLMTRNSLTQFLTS